MTVYLVNVAIYEGGSYFVAAYDTRIKANIRKAKEQHRLNGDNNTLDKPFVKSVKMR